MSTQIATPKIPNAKDWLRNRIAQIFDAPSDSIDLGLSLEDMALDSVNVVTIAGELEELLGGIEIDSSLMYEYETLNAFCEQLEVRYARHLENAKENGVPISIRVAASFTSEPTEEALAYFLKCVGYAPQISYSGYQQVLQELVTPGSGFDQNPGGVNVIFFRIEDFFRFESFSENIEARAHDICVQFVTYVDNFVSAHKSKLVICLCPHTAATIRKLGLSHALGEIDRRLMDALADVSGIEIIDARDLDQSYLIRKTFDDARDKFGHIPFTPEYFSALGYQVARSIFNLMAIQTKVIVFDCDNTLWKGVVGEDGIAGIQIDQRAQDMQRFAIAQQAAGQLICLASKNNAADVDAVFEKRGDMLLQPEHIVSKKVNWTRKSQNIQDLAKELNLGLDSFVFIDDNPAECHEVESVLPDVHVIHYDDAIKDVKAFLDNYWIFDVRQETLEDRNRTQMYKESAAREQIRKRFAEYDDFVKDLKVQTTTAMLATDRITRAAQLTHRTNQFNSTTIRRSEAEITRLAQDDRFDILCTNVEDRFGDYGFVGLTINREALDEYVCEAFMMSCRVLGKQVEQNMIRDIANRALSRGINKVRISYRKSERNLPVENFLTSLSATRIERGDGDFDLTFRAVDVETVLAGSKVHHEIKKKSNAPNPQDQQAELEKPETGSPDGLSAVAIMNGDTSIMLQALKGATKMKRGVLSTEFVAPRTAWHRNLASIWCDILGLDRVGIHDSFFELGGDSLRAAEAFARMWELGVPDSISLINIPEPKVAMLAQAIEDVKAGREPTLITDQFSLSDEGQVPVDIGNYGYDVNSYDKPMKTVFLTGGTGYLGASLLSELLIQTDVKIICLVRAATPEQGKERIIQNMSQYSLWRDAYLRRIEIVLGELAEPNLGLTDAAFKSLGHRIDTVFHSGAWVNFVFPYQRLKPSHIDAMEHIMRLCVVAKPKPISLHFISTLGVIMSTGYTKDDVVMEDAPLEHVEGLLNGYEQAKHVADKMAFEGMKRGIPTAIYRPGMVGGFSETGAYDKLDEFLSSFFKGCLQMGSWPLLDTTWEVVPVDFICKAIVHGAKDPKNLNQAYFTLHPEPTEVRDYIQWFQDFGYPMRALPWDVWKRELISQGAAKLKQNALFPFVDFLRALEDEQVRFPTTDRRNFNRLVAEAGLSVPSQLEILERYIRHFISKGFIDAPMTDAFDESVFAKSAV